jgi:hypothetical protein
MHLQKNEVMNKSIMRYCPKEKMYCRTMSLTWRINLAISIDMLGHTKLYEELFEKEKKCCSPQANSPSQGSGACGTKKNMGAFTLGFKGLNADAASNNGTRWLKEPRNSKMMPKMEECIAQAFVCMKRMKLKMRVSQDQARKQEQ